MGHESPDDNLATSADVERDTPRSSFAHMHPSDRILLSLLAVAVVVYLVRFSSVGTTLLLVQTSLFCGFGLLAMFLARLDTWSGTPTLRALATTAVVFTCYTTLGRLGMVAMPYTPDAALSEVDNRLFGFDPSLALQRYQSPGWVEFYAFFYSIFIPYINLSLLLNCLGRPAGQRDAFLTGWVVTYAISYLGYIFVPAHGPLWLHAADYDVTLSGGYFYRTVVDAVESTGGLQGVFPSLHVGGSVFWCAYDMKLNRLRGLTYLPIVLLIYVATLFLRYHYVIDLIAGTIIALAAIPIGEAIVRRWSARRVSLGMAPYPGGGAR